ncbi:MAG: FAD-binding protein [Archangium sp.]|nr:FAD-binding protein [Archangium sp.]
MTTLTTDEARALESTFTGRITPLHEAHPEFPGKPPVLIPESVKDLEVALQLAKAADRKVFVQSGHSVSRSDVVSPVSGAVISMEAFGSVEVDGRRIIIGVAATNGDAAPKLMDTANFLPIDDDPTQSILSAVLGNQATPFPRSARGLPPLRGGVVQAQVVPTTGAGAGAEKTLLAPDLPDLWAGRGSAVVTRLVLDATKWDRAAAHRWLRVWVIDYSATTFTAACDALFARAGISEDIDLSVRVTTASFGMTLVIVRATGCGDADRQEAEAFVQRVTQAAGSALLSSHQVDGAGSSVAAWVTTGPGRASANGEVQTRYASSAPRPFADFRNAFYEAVDFAMGVDGEGHERARGVDAWAELRLVPGGDVEARARIADARADATAAKVARILMDSVFPAPPIVEMPAARGALRGVEVLPELSSVAAFDLAPSNRVGAMIPDFEGDAFARNSGEDYRKAAARQYAASSYDSAVVQQRMSPAFIAEPLHARDVVAAVTFAAAQRLKVVTRSGGHQYCGLSSGGDRTLVLDMKRFNSDPVFSEDGTQVTVGPGVKLRDLSCHLRRRKVVIPHGECPLVNLGGHVQTGGIGHQLRSFGLTLDWVRSFKMVTATRAAGGGYEERTFTRPAAGAAPGAAPGDADVFRAVLGGGPGSWGVLTEITFGLVRDQDCPNSYGYSGTYLYEKDAFRVAMEHMRLWTKRAEAGELPAGIDLFLSVVSGEFSLSRPNALLRPGVLLVELMAKDETGIQEVTEVVRAVEHELSLRARLSGKLSILAQGVKGRTPVSVIGDEGVRNIGAFGLPKSGREFDLPYKKSCNVTMRPLTEKFCDKFVDLVHRVNATRGLNVVFQGMVCGGEVAMKAGATHMQRRDGLVQLVFDVFYEPEKKAAAEAFQAEMKTLLGDFSGGPSHRMFWGTFEDPDGGQLDMSKESVQQLYYDSPDEYRRLQLIKKYVDPDDLFHTSFTVKLPG